MALPSIPVNLGLERKERLPAALLVIFFVILCFAGGASREDVLSQAVVRATACLLLIVQIVSGRLPRWDRYRVCFLILGSMIGLATLQLVPLPPGFWSALPGRTIPATSPLGAQSWRPLNLVPDAGLNALFSLLAPLCALSLLSTLGVETVHRARYLLLGAILLSAVVALLQSSGGAPSNDLINGSTDDYGGTFANRNHQALFLAIGIAVAWFWGFERGSSWRDRRLWFATAVVLLLSVSILVTGSRSGAILGTLAIVAGPLLANLRQGKTRSGRIVRMAIWTVVSLFLAASVLAFSAYLGRAESLNRAATLDVSEDFRLVALPTVWQIAKTYFPFGAGLGSFNAVFRMAEPLSLLKPTYFNHAHDDFLEVVIETGIAGPAILLAALGWLCRRSVAAFAKHGRDARMGRLGVLVVMLVVFASVSDYPARTPIIMVTLAVAAAWVTGASGTVRREGPIDALPANTKPL